MKGFNLVHIDYSAVAEYDRRGFRDDEGVQAHFQTVHIDVTLHTTESQEKCDELQVNTQH
jgi:hypothetical protein